MKRLWIFAGFLIFTLASCDKDFESLNQNPLAPTQVSDGSIFNGIVNSLRLGWNRQLFLHNEILYGVTEQAVVTAQTFGNVSGGAEDIWTNYYEALKNANALYRNFNEEIYDQQKAQLDIIMAYKTFQVTDMFGDIPYSQAGLAFGNDPILRPSYDSQESIYKKCLTDLQQASEILSRGGQTSEGENYQRYGSFESLFNDNLDKWIRFSNSLQLRYLLRIYEKDPGFVEPRIKILIESGANTLVKDGDALMSPRDQQWSNLGVNWSFREHNKVRMGSTVWNFMTDTSSEIIDPRARWFFETNNADEWVAFPQIANTTVPQSGGEPYQKDRRDSNYEDKGFGNIYSPVNFYLIRDEQDIPEILISSAEVQFLKAEIFTRGIGVAQDPFLASAAYQNGMIESLEFWQNLVINSEAWVNKPEILTTGQLFSTLSHPKYSYDVSGEEEINLYKIYSQRWIDLFRQPWEAFSLLRRTNLVPRANLENQFYRFQYPPSESALNSESYNVQVSNMGADATDVKVWWME